jgi:hypothetical protein
MAIPVPTVKIEKERKEMARQVFFCTTGIQTQGLTLATQMLLPPEPLHQPQRQKS